MKPGVHSSSATVGSGGTLSKSLKPWWNQLTFCKMSGFHIIKFLRSFSEEVHVTLSPPCTVRSQEASATTALDSSGTRSTWQEINRGSHTRAWTESVKEHG